MRLRHVVLPVLLLAACGGGDHDVAVGASPSTSSTARSSTSITTTSTTSTTIDMERFSPSTTAPTGTTVPLEAQADPAHPHFSSPESAMRYLADAWNRDDQVSLKHVTNPAARDQLDGMHDVAIDLVLDHCEEREGMGDYQCTFVHGYPPGVDRPEDGGGYAVFLVGPADAPGWYMTAFQGCG